MGRALSRMKPGQVVRKCRHLIRLSTNYGFGRCVFHRLSNAVGSIRSLRRRKGMPSSLSFESEGRNGQWPRTRFVV